MSDDTIQPEAPVYGKHRHVFPRPWTLASGVPRSTRYERWKRQILADSYEYELDRVNVLGDEMEGHTGCVNALSWAEDGRFLLSGGDDTTVRLWRIDESNTTVPYPYRTTAIVQTGHTGNIFNAQMLPHSSRIATVAADKQVRVFDVESALSLERTGHGTDEALEISTTPIRILRCHTSRTKRLVTEESSDLFLTVAEDGTVRQHDLRVSHRCLSGCPAPLVKLGHSLSALALSPLTPYQFVVAGESPYGYLFDRRQSGRFIKEEWGVPPNDDELTTCVRRFGRRTRGPSERKGCEHITGARMPGSNGHEVLLSYSSDSVYLYSTRDDPEEFIRNRNSSKSLLPANAKAKVTSYGLSVNGSVDADADWATEGQDTLMADEDEEADSDSRSGTSIDTREADKDTEPEEEEDDHTTPHSDVPVVYPRKRFVGACNAETVKDVNFLGPNDEYVVSGSDDGNFFVWRKNTAELHGIYEGDGSVVNVIEGHPSLPVVAVSGIDTTVKLFSPVFEPSAFSRMNNAESIISRNQEATVRQIDLASLFHHYRLALRRSAPTEGGDEEEEPECTFQ
ncbi:WD40 repeat-like protein [Dentipellis sp. KUC8613]|nr:WD40 repeat-like protein [Dentipellis sp. KUC8613]